MENYKDKYEKALERAKDIYNDDPNSSTARAVCEQIFPELKESEDERIRKQLLNWFKDCNWDAIDNETLKRDDIIAWLEKQGEQGEIDYDEELKRCKANPIYFFDKYVKVKLKEQKPAWSEEDEEMFDAIIADIQFTQKAHTHDVNQIVYEREIDWLKSLKERMKGE